MTDEVETGSLSDVELRAVLVKQAAAFAGLSPDELDESRTLDSLGLDSSDAVVLALQIQNLLGGEVELGVFLAAETLGEAFDQVVREYRRNGFTPPRT